MKNVLVALFVAGFTLTSVFAAPQAQASNIAQTLCELVAADDKKRMRSYLKSNKLKLRSVFDSISCNGKNLLAFAGEANAQETGAMIVSKLPKSVLSTVLASITSAELAAIAEKRVNS